MGTGGEGNAMRVLKNNQGMLHKRQFHNIPGSSTFEFEGSTELRFKKESEDELLRIQNESKKFRQLSVFRTVVMLVVLLVLFGLVIIKLLIA